MRYTLASLPILPYHNEERLSQHHWESQTRKMGSVIQQTCPPQSEATLGTRHISRALFQQRRGTQCWGWKPRSCAP